MSLIVCATGNGDRSRSVQARAVEAARRQQKRLVFVHVVDVEQLAELDESLKEAAQAELVWLGSAIMRLAQDRAQRLGVHAESVVLYGNVCSALEEFLTHQPVDLLLMGEASNATLLSFARHVQDDLGIPVQLVVEQAD
jgi:nucleotide-binding universal stress UspA family protein